MAIAELPANTVDKRANNLPSPEIVRAAEPERGVWAEDKDSPAVIALAADPAPEQGIDLAAVVEISRAIGQRAERAREILAVLIDPAVALVPETWVVPIVPVVAPALRHDQLVAAEIVSAIEACHPADLAATVHLVVVAEARPDRPVRVVDTAWAAADLAVVEDEAEAAADAAAEAEEDGANNSCTRKNP